MFVDSCCDVYTQVTRDAKNPGKLPASCTEWRVASACSMKVLHSSQLLQILGCESAPRSERSRGYHVQRIGWGGFPQHYVFDGGA